MAMADHGGVAREGFCRTDGGADDESAVSTKRRFLSINLKTYVRRIMSIRLKQFHADLTLFVSIIITGQSNESNAGTDGTSSVKAMHRMTLVTSFLFVLFLFSGPASAAKVPNKEAASLMTQCMLADDSKMPKMPYGRAKCCSKSLGYCIYCPGNLPRKCVKTALSSTTNQDWSKIPLPNTGGVVAPTPPPAPNAYDYRMQTPRSAPNVYDRR